MVSKIFIYAFIILVSASCLENKGKVYLGVTPDGTWPKQMGLFSKASSGNNEGDDYCNSTAVDIHGNIFCAGATSGDMGEPNGGGFDAFIMKLSPSGELLWVRQLGSITKAVGGDNSADDYCNEIALDQFANAYCSGHTKSSMGEANAGNRDAFVMKVSHDGTLQWVKQLGTITQAVGGSNAGNDYCKGISLDTAGNIYCAGYTNGSMGEANGGNYDAFIMKLSSAGNLQWLTQFGSVTTEVGGNNSGDDYCNGVSVDSGGNVYCGGFTRSSMGEASGGNRDAFVVKLRSNGTLKWLKQLGNVTNVMGGNNSGDDYCNGISSGNEGNVFCGGYTSGSIGEVNGGGFDAFVMKMDTFGSLQWVKQMGSVTKGGGTNSGDDYCNGVNVDQAGDVYCAGNTTASIGEGNGGNQDAFLMKFKSSGDLQWVRQFGETTAGLNGNNSGNDFCLGSSVDSEGNAYCVGLTEGALGEPNGGGQDAFVLKLSSNGILY